MQTYYISYRTPCGWAWLRVQGVPIKGAWTRGMQLFVHRSVPHDDSDYTVSEAKSGFRVCSGESFGDAVGWACFPPGIAGLAVAVDRLRRDERLRRCRQTTRCPGTGDACETCTGGPGETDEIGRKLADLICSPVIIDNDVSDGQHVHQGHAIVMSETTAREIVARCEAHAAAINRPRP